jgi:hypothetical protein
LATPAHRRGTRPDDLIALIDLVRARRCDHVFAGEDVRLEMLATLEALAIKLASHGLMGATAKYEMGADGRLAFRELKENG